MKALILLCKDIIALACDFSKNTPYFHVRTHGNIALKRQQKGIVYDNRQGGPVLLEKWLLKPLMNHRPFNY